MRFYGKKNTIVWNGELNKVLCKFDSNGEVELDDPEEVEKMKSLGYMGDYTEPSAGFTGEEPEIDIREGGAMAKVVMKKEDLALLFENETETITNEPIDITTLTVKELRKLLSDEGYKGLYKMNREQLVEAAMDWIRGEE